MIWAGMAVQAAVFGLWAFIAFRTLFRLLAWGQRDTGRPLPGPGTTLRAFAAFFREDGFALDRRHLGLATLALAAVMAANAVLLRP